MTPAILVHISNAVARITLNRPEQANVIDSTMAQAFVEAVSHVHNAQSRGEVRAVLLDAHGPHFCAGGDIRGFAASGDIAGMLDRGIPALHVAIHTLSNLPVPVVCAVAGSLGGGGIGLALCADIVLASASMKLRAGYTSIGLSPDMGVSWVLTRLVGPMRTKQILFTNEAMNAQQCLAAGLVAEVYDEASLIPAAQALVGSLAKGATGALGRSKAMVDQAVGHALLPHLALEHLSMVTCGASAEAREGVQAFIEKRAPRFGA
jgi:2-(1,2-epoxy-1,2-dihydrophenyl)acetyl-CoA isomerase